MSKMAVSLDDKYALPNGRVYLTGIQALVRLPMAQRQRDRAQGLNTGGFISGYRGSPLGGYDQALTQARRFLERENIRFVPGVNEDLAATSVWGSQQLNLTPGATVDGVFGIWYGKGPGVDRSLDVFKHANSAGTDPKGGVLAILGDDHGCQSSTLAHQSEHVLMSALMPVVNPATLQEYIDFGLLGFALSRYSGCWVGFKAVTETVESSSSIMIDPEGFEINTPTDFLPPVGGLGIRWPDPPLVMEQRLHGPKLEAIAAFARVNRFDWPIWLSAKRRLGIISTGKAYLDLRQALEALGIDEARAVELGVAVYKVGLTWPLETSGAVAFARDFDEIVVVEEKRGVIEDQLLKALYNLPRRPMVVGKTDELGRALFPSEGELNPQLIGIKLAHRLLARVEDPTIRQSLARLEDRSAQAPVDPAKLVRTPFFCSGCPHNTSTRLPDGSRAMAGIGCHGMAGAIPERRTALITHMGGEGAVRIGQAPFTSEPHVFQNMGDGTYYHSGLLAIRAAVAAGINITYKILFNDAVAMTGGQPHDGPLSVTDITRQVSAEGAKKVFVVTDEPEKYEGGPAFAAGTEIRHRSELDAVQRELRDIPGLTVLVYDQACAAEKRRKRKRGLYPDPPKRVFINARVCEGCGDCSEKSNCVAVKPLETEFGRKRQIDQSDCNKDFACLTGFCPSFMTVKGGTIRKAAKTLARTEGLFETLPEPTLPILDGAYGILVTGIGGTGVITVGALMGMAAHIEGKGCTVLDFTGLAQKNGSVMSHIRLSPTPDDLYSVRIAEGEADVLIGCDMLVAASPNALSRMDRRSTRAVVNDHLQPTAGFVRNTNLDFGGADVRRSLKNAIGDSLQFVNATGLATALMGDSIATNLFMLGFAWQSGLIPLRRQSIEAAIELNGVAVEANKRTFAWGRLAAHDKAAVEAAARPTMRTAIDTHQTLEDVIERRFADLVKYQDTAYAERFRRIVEEAFAAETKLGAGSGYALAVARNLYKLMAIKDEYEVARLYTDGEFLQKLEAQFEPGFKLEFNLAPPLFARRDKATGELQKRAYGPWIMNALKALAAVRGIRGSLIDVFSYTAERRMERRLLDEYILLIRDTTGKLTAGNHAGAVELANWPSMIRGYGHVKDRHIALARQALPELIQSFSTPAATKAAA